MTMLSPIAAICLWLARAVIADVLADESAPSLALPVDCTLGDTCHVQFHVDLAPGPEIVDHACRRLTYDGHKGTDIRLPDYPAMRGGVAVLAAADGEVRAICEGEPDISVDGRGTENLQGKDAGNAVVIAHDNGWETQYSHLMLGSVAVKPGDKVKTGQILGTIGLSGRSNFPHLDFGVRLNGAVVDPFLGADTNVSCGHPGTPLWNEAALTALPYRPGGVLLAGFAAVEPNKAEVREGAARTLAFDADAPLLVFYADVFGILAGDTEELRIIAPDGSVFAEHRKALERDYQQRFEYYGRKRPAEGWRLGTYRGEYRLTRTVAGVTQVIASARRDAVISGR